MPPAPPAAPDTCSRAKPVGPPGNAPLWQLRRPSAGLPKSNRRALRSLSYEELAQWLDEHLALPRYRRDQIFRWLHHTPVSSFAAMSNLSRADRERLQAKAVAESLQVREVQTARDGTRKLRLETSDGYALESVLIPNAERGYTQCISSQVGCAVDCSFCATATMGFRRNLDASEIIDQVHIARRMLGDGSLGHDPEDAGRERIANIVYMGMGEPLHNFNHVQRSLEMLTDPRGAGLSGQRITISTSGLVPAIERFVQSPLAERFGLAVSLNATTDEVRDRVMPINQRWNIATLLATVGKIPSKARRRLTFEYVLLADVNDSDDDARRLGRLLNRFRCHVNVIPFNPHPQAPYARPSAQRVERFMEGCRKRGLSCFLRTPRGDDIDAACGQLALKGYADAPGPLSGHGD